ncbi:ABC transporter permease [bacterium]|jgi:ABC-type polysaccharide/polyol phosphate export permease|nr:ABC transporter permease [bacterium]
MKVKQYGKIFCNLLWRDLVVLKSSIVREMINTAFWICLTIFVYAYLMPQLCAGGTFGMFVLVGSIPCIMLFKAVNKAAELVADLGGRQSFLYYFTTPLPYWLIFIRRAFSIALYTIPLSLLMFLIGGVLIWDQMDFSNASILKFIPIFLASNFLVGFCSLWFASWIEKIGDIEAAWFRYVFPCWWLGGYLFSWETFNLNFPLIAKINLINPILYTIEGIRASIIGQEGQINYWICLGMVCLFTIIIAIRAIVLFKRRLDCV